MTDTIQQLYPLTSSQREIWFDQMMHPELPHYNIGGYAKILGTVKPQLYERAINLLVQQHDNLRIVIQKMVDEDGIPLQSFAEQMHVTVPLIDFSNHSDPHEAAISWMNTRLQEPFSGVIERDGTALFRFDLIKLSPDCFYLMNQCHHLITDGWSVALIGRSLADIYTQLANGEQPSIERFSYVDFIEDDRRYAQSKAFEKNRKFWLTQYPTAPEPLLAPVYQSKFTEKAIASGCENLHLSWALYEQLAALAKQHQATLYHVLLGALYVYFTRIAQRDDFPIGLPVLNRSNAKYKKTGGLFVGISPVLFNFGKELTFAQLLQQIDQTLMGNYRHQRFPVSELNRMLGLKSANSQLFDISLSYEKFDHQLSFAGLESQSFSLLHHYEQTPLMIFVREYHEQQDVECNFVYNLAYFNADDIKAFQTRFVNILQAVITQDQLPLQHLPIMANAETEQLQAWNQTQTDYPKDKTIVDLFERQVDINPDNIAVVFEDNELNYQSLSYLELNTQANQLAHCLIAQGVKADTLVGICVERSVEMIVGLLGILKAGGAYVPLDPSYPKQRLAFMLEDTQVSMLLTQSHLQEHVPASSAKVICLDEQTVFAPLATGNPKRRSEPHDLAYVIYTSGSTGKPKGVMVCHQALHNRIDWMDNQYQADVTDKILQKTPFSFDVSVWEFFWPLSQGAQLIIAKPEGHTDVTYLCELIQRQGVTKLHFVPSMLSVMLVQGQLDRCQSIRQVFCSGEALHISHVEAFNQCLPSAQLHNLYGPTEAAIDVSHWDCSQPLAMSVPIGKPIQNIQLMVLDRHLQMVPQGVAGELYIGGDGLARGYLNRPELTAEKFIDIEVFGKTQRVYKTGDLARWLPDGNLEYLGRIDHQVKLRGFRIELGEIEAVLRQHPYINEAVVTLFAGDNNQRLVAYITANQNQKQDSIDENIESAKLRNWLKGQLPDYMVPASFTLLDKLPLTPNGKIDRKALPDPQVLTYDVNGSDKPIRTDSEQLLATLWSGVLNLEVKSSKAQFFELGGHSLLAIQLISRIRDSFGVDMPLSVLFAHPILGELAHWLDQQQRSVAVPTIIAQSEDTQLQLSYAQQRLWFLAQLEGSSITYNMPAALKLNGTLNIAALRQTFIKLVERHQSLRQSFKTIDGEASVQCIDVYDPLTITNLCELESSTSDNQTHQLNIREHIERHAQHIFDLSAGKLLQIELLVLSDSEHILLFNMHHIISDGWSMSLLVQQWGELYKAYAQNQTPTLEPLAIQYSDYAIWQRQWLQGDVLQQQLDYWTQQLDGAPELLELPTDLPRPSVQSYQGAQLKTQLSQSLSQQLKAFSGQYNCTLFMTLLSAFNLLLHRYSGQDDILIGSPIANRNNSQTEQLIGMFVNTLVMRTRFEETTTFTQLLKQTRQTALDGYAHQDIAFEHLVEKLNPQRSVSYSPLFQVMFVLQNTPDNAPQMPGLQIQAIAQETPIAKFDLTLSVNEVDEHLELTWEYATDLFKVERIARMAEHFSILLEAVCHSPDVNINELPMLTSAETEQLQAWNQTQTDYPKDKTIVDLFERQVDINPDNIAVVFEDTQLNYQALSYLELNKRANQLAHWLIAQDVKADTLVGICIERSVEMIVGLLGILKAGGAYVPLDPSYPQERLAYMLEDTQVKVLLTQSHLQERVPASSTKVICLDEQAVFKHFATDNPKRRIEPHDLAYVIYTSGSTGKPKGVMVSHQAIHNRIDWVGNQFRADVTDKILQKTPFSFDVSVWEFFWPLSQGAQLIIAKPEGHTDVTYLCELIQRQGVTKLHFVPSMLSVMLAQGQLDRCQSIRQVFCSGEALHISHVEAFNQCLPSAQLHNLYGPTEAAIEVSHWDCSQSLAMSVPIGKPIQNIQLMVLDRHLQMVPQGVAGELYIGGDGLARGYLNRPELTAEKFIHIEVFGKTQRVYKTGDLACWLPDGNLEYLGRIDHQVKLRGFRIELGEIEAVLSQHPYINEAVVTLFAGDNNQRLVAYITANQNQKQVSIDEKIQAGELRNWLKSQLPEYMVPASFIVLDKLPLTSNGKIDRKALPQPQVLTHDVNGSDKPIRTDSEQLLATLWSGVLNLEVKSTKAQFFELGGHSLLAIQLVSRIRDSFGVDMPLSVLFAHPILGKMAHWLDQQQHSKSLPTIIAQSEDTPLQLSYAQQRLWFLAQLEGSSITYNMPAAVKLNGTLNIAALRQTFITLVERHQSLRQSFKTIDGEASVQCIEVYDPLTITNLCELESRKSDNKTPQSSIREHIERHAQHIFDLSAGKLLQIELLVLSDSEHILLFNMHHIISDGWSMSLLVQQWGQFYKAYAQNQTPALEPLAIQYSDYAIWQRQWLHGDVLQQQLDYWTQQLDGAPELLELPTDAPRLPVQSYQGAQLKTQLSQSLSQRIKAFSGQRNCTLFMTLLSAFNLLLHRYSGQDDILVGSPVANRNNSQTEQLIGMFVNTLVMRTRFEETTTFTQLLKQTRQTALNGYAHQDIAFEHLVEKLNPQRSLSYSPLFQVMFALENTPDLVLEMPGLQIQEIVQDSPIAKFDLSLSVKEVGEQLELCWEYATDLFKVDRIARMAEHFSILLEAVCQSPDININQLPMLTSAETEQLQAWNQTQIDYPKDKTIVDLFERQVDINPDNIAVVFEDNELSYQALNKEANQLAHCLIAQGVKADTLVGICVERSVEMIIALLGVLKAGGAYVPLDPSYPQERLTFIIEDAQVSMLLTQTHLQDKFPMSSAKVICLDEQAVFKHFAINNPQRHSSAEDLAYVIYTSGSTGKPKGVVIENGAIASHCQLMRQHYQINQSDKILQFASFSFDTSIEQIYTSWLGGASLVLLKNNLIEPQAMVEYLELVQITVADFPPAYWQQLLAITNLSERLSSLRLLNLGGDVLPVSLAQTTRQQFPALLFINCYGPTEAVITASTYPVPAISLLEQLSAIPIGKPCSDKQIYIINTENQLQPIGIIGELCIAGAGLARGYLNRPELTAEKFINIELFGKTQRVYKTGDLARWLPDGKLEFLGRIDHQVKLRGFRIELGEIEAALSQHPAVNEAVVTLFAGDNNQRLVAYITANQDKKQESFDERIQTGELHNWLKGQLPDYMVPASFTLLDKLPLTSNGKIDRRALPDPQVLANDLSGSDKSITTDSEQLLATLWSGVLNLEVKSTKAQFFELGGHSLLAIQLVSRIRDCFSVDMPLSVLFAHPILGEMAHWLDQQQRSVAVPPIIAQSKGGQLQLSYAQQRLWFLAQLEGSSITYNMPAAVKLNGTINIPALRQTFIKLVERHQSLRQSFKAIDGEASVQYIDVYDPLTITNLFELESSTPDNKTPQSSIREHIDRHAQHLFDLSAGKLLQIELLVLSDNEHILLFNMHHIISDGWSMSLLVQQWGELYSAYAQNQTPELEPLAIQYSDYAIWQRQWLQGDVLQQQLDYWTQQLDGAPELLELPTDLPRPSVQSYQGAQLKTQLSQSLSQRIKVFSGQHNSTLFMTLLSAFNLLLHRYSGQDDILVGSPVANRNNSQTEQLIGMFVNTLVMRTRFEETTTFTQLLKQTRQTALDGYAHQDIPFEHLVEKLNPQRSLSYSPLFQVMFVLQNTPESAPQMPGLQIQAIGQETPIAKFDLSLSVKEVGEQLELSWEYATDLFKVERIARMAEHFSILLEAVCHSPDVNINQLPMLTAAETEQLQAWNQTATDYPKDKTIVDLFEKQVDINPDNIAVVFEDNELNYQALSYLELNKRANQLAHCLIAQGVKADTLVGICVERSVEMIVALLGILKAGGAYVPLDPSYPKQRLAFMLEDAQVSVLLTQSHLQEHVPASSAKVICLDEQAVFAHLATGNPKRRSEPHDLAYVIYTSGSTGKPKGVMLNHQSVTNYLTHVSNYLEDPINCSVMTTSLNFDATVTSLFGAWLRGGRLKIIPETNDIFNDLLKLMQSEQSALFKVTPAHLQGLNLQDVIERKHVVIVGGEAFSCDLAEKVSTMMPNSYFINEYGPTEATVGCSYETLQSSSLSSYEGFAHIPIGKPILNTQIFVIDKGNNPLPIGVTGELCIAGAGLARGYLNRPELTAEKFINIEVFGKTQRVYKTGDLARWLPDGKLEFLGRIDHQVKLRGFRIELGEIEAALRQHPAVNEAVVTLLAGDNNQRLVAYIIQDSIDENIESVKLRNWLKGQLPDYMVPASFTLLDKLPLTPNGKIDRKALPDPQVLANDLSGSDKSITTDSEQLLATLWSGVLNLEVKSTKAQFFELGGHSLLAIQLISRIRDSFNVDMPLSVLFAHPILGEMAHWLDQQQRSVAVPTIIAQSEDTPLQLSYAQQRLWFLAQLEGSSSTYNMPAALKLNGTLNIAALRQTFIKLVERHQSLRQSFKTIDGEASVQCIDVYDPLTITTLCELESSTSDNQTHQLNIREHIERHAQHIFDLSAGKLLQIELLVLSDSEHILLFNMHHIISDGWSMSLLVQQWGELYKAYAQNQTPALEPLAIQYSDYAIWQRQWLQGDVLQQQLDYWTQQLDGAPELLELPTDAPRPSVQSYQGAQLKTQLSQTLSQRIKAFSGQHNCTLFMTLLSAFNLLLHRYSGQDDILIGSPIANRNNSQTEQLIGMFVNTLVMRTRFEETTTFTQLLKQTRQTALDGYAHQDIAFEHLVEKLNPQRSVSYSPLFQVMFVLQNTPDNAPQMPGLQIQAIAQETSIAKFDLTLSVNEVDEHLELTWEYATDLFKVERIARMAEHFSILLEAVCHSPDVNINELPMLTSAETEQLQAWNQTQTDYPKDKTIVDLFERQVDINPDNIAVVFEGKELSYHALNKEANQLAHCLIAQGVKADSLVGICVERSVEMIVGLLGILKAGGAYVPLDPSYPQERLAYMLEDTQVSVLLTQSHLQERVPASSAKVICLDENTVFAHLATDNPKRRSEPHDLAYVIYTSGSTGKPKGVMVSHQAIHNRIDWMGNQFRADVTDKILQKTPFSFDVSVWEFFWPLSQGAQLIIAKPEGHKDLIYLCELIERQGVTKLHFVPSMLSVMLTQGRLDKCQSIRHVFCSGEALHISHVEAFNQCLPSAQLHNLYGPTEAAIEVSHWDCSQPLAMSVPIGKPIQNIQLMVLDRHLQMVPQGVAGELYIGGDGLARGYLNRPELTAEKFIDIEVFGKTQRVYKTGDLARWLPDGNLEYLDRIDHQVKLHGFRIELGEIETAICQHPAINEAVVTLFQRDNNQRLVAYITAIQDKKQASFDEKTQLSELRNWLKDQLPEHMVPASFTVLDELPLTPNGKLDRKALPAPDITLSHQRYQPPRNHIEQQLADVWSSVLNQSAISINDNFFDLGGDSIISIQIVARARQLGLGLSPRAVFEHQTIAELSQVVEQVSQTTAEQGLVTGPVPLTPIQFHFFARDYATDNSEPWHFNQAVMLEVAEQINESAMSCALSALLAHHDALRLRYHQVDGLWQQSHCALDNTPDNTSDNTPNKSVPFHTETLNVAHGDSLEQVLEERGTYWQQSLDLTNGPVTRLVQFKTADSCFLLWVIHHLVVDGVSWRILTEDLQLAYQQAKDGQSIRLVDKSTSFKAWSEQLQHWQQSDAFNAQRQYWQQQPCIESSIPVDCPQAENLVEDTQYQTLTLNSQITEQLLKQAPSAYRTGVDDLLLSALLCTLHEWTGQRQHVIDLESHGRADLFDTVDLSRTVGWFTSLYSAVLSLPKQDLPQSSDTNHRLGEVIKSVKEQLRQIPHEGIGYGLLLQQQSQNKPSVKGHLPKGQVLFNYLGQISQSNEQQGFKLSQYPTGRSHSLSGRREHLIDINAITVQGELSFTFSYSDKQYRSETIEKLAKRYEHHLIMLLEHCQSHFGYTPSDFPLSGLNQQQLDNLSDVYQHNISAIYPLSPMQQGMLFHSLKDPNSGDYITQLSLQLSGDIEPAILREAWQQLVNRHPILRTAFVYDQKSPLQIVAKETELCWQTLDWQALDWQALSPSEQQEQQQNLLAQQRQQGFDFTQPSLMRLQLVQTSANDYQLHWHHHHILMDGWCLPIIFSELFHIYSALSQQQLPELSGINNYQHYIAWLVQQNDSTAREHWQTKLAGFATPTPISIAKYSQKKADCRHSSIALDAEQTAQLEQLAKKQRVTLNTLIQGAWALLLSRYSGEHDIVFGVTTSGRNVPLSGVENMIGLFINTLPLRVNLDNDLSDVLQSLQAQQQLDDQYTYSSLAQIQGWSEVPNGTALFDSIVVFENYPVDEALNQSQNQPFHVSNIETVEQTNYLLTLSVLPGEKLVFKLSFDQNRIEPVAIERLLEHLCILLKGMVPKDMEKAPDANIHQLPLLSSADIQQLQAWNQTATDYPRDKTIVDLFEQQVAMNPNNIAVVFEDTQLNYQPLSYLELNTQANQLAHCLIAQGVKADSLVGICVERSVEMIVGLLGILKAGGAYVPLDSSYPQERLAYMLEDTQVSVLLTQSHLQADLPASSAKVICLDEQAVFNHLATINPTRRSEPQDLAYVIYTSGSTGKPKGVMVCHQALHNRIDWMDNQYHADVTDKILQKTPFSFDVSVWEFFWPLIKGAQLIIAKPEGHKDLIYLCELIERQGVTKLHFVPSMLSVMLAQGQLDRCQSIRQVFCSGEALHTNHVEAFKQCLPSAQLHNLYGPTEAAIDVSYWDCSQPLGMSVPIGKPIQNIQLMVLDKHLQVVPQGVSGELYIGGDGLARGYLNRPELTDEKFINIEVFDKTQRVYKTGDLARWLPDGNLEYLGRIDHQVKLRGFRIELGEIEEAVCQHPYINEAVVTLFEGDNNQRLVAYITATQDTINENNQHRFDEKALINELRHWLKSQLPEYMVPTSFTILDKLPLTANGKINRKALPTPMEAISQKSHTLARNTLELRMLKLWQTVLELDSLGVNDDFFEVGGHSLMAMPLVSQIRQQFKVELPVSILFQCPTVAQICLHLQQHMQPNGTALLWSDCVSIHNEGKQQPIFLLPGAVGSVLYLQPLAEQLGKEQPLYALQTPGIYCQQCTPETVEGLANYHIKALRKEQPNGPYQLVGHSSGGRVAFEIALQLEQQGEEVGFLGIMDTSAPDIDLQIAEFADTDEYWLWDLIRLFKEISDRDLQLTLEGLEALDNSEAAYAAVLKVLKKNQLMFTPQSNVEELKRWVKAYRATIYGHTSYLSTGKLRCPIHLFKADRDMIAAEQGHIHIDNRPAWGWGSHTQAKVEEISVSGNHATMMAAPHVETLAKVIKSRLNLQS